jgi:hypothetical protein
MQTKPSILVPSILALAKSVAGCTLSVEDHVGGVIGKSSAWKQRPTMIPRITGWSRGRRCRNP